MDPGSRKPPAQGCTSSSETPDDNCYENIEPPDENYYEYIEANKINNKFTCNEELAEKVRNKEDPYSSSDDEVNSRLCTEVLGVDYKNRRKWVPRSLTKNGKNIILLEKEQKPTIVLSAKNKLLNCLIDSGSDKCLIKYETLEELDSLSEIKKANVKVNGLNGTSRVTGKTDLKLKLGEEEITCKALVLKNMNYPGHIILGRDLLETNNAILDFGKNKITINGVDVDFSRSTKDKELSSKMREDVCLMANYVSKGRRKKAKDKSKLKKSQLSKEDKNDIRKTKAKVHLSCETTLEAGTFKVLYGHSNLIPGEYNVKKKYDNAGYIVAEGICKVNDDGRVPVGVVNMTSEDIILDENTMLAEIELFEEIESYSVVVENMLDELRENGIRSKKDFKNNEANEVERGVKGTHPKRDIKNKKEEKKRINSLIKPNSDVISGGNERSGENGAVGTTELEGSFYSNEPRSGQMMNKEICIKNDIKNDINEENKKKEIKEEALYKEKAKKELNFEELKLNVDESTSKSEDGVVHRLKNLLNEYREIISLDGEGIGRTNLLTHKIRLKDERTVINTPSYRVPHKYQSLLDIELAKMKDQGLIEDSISPFNSPVLVVKKKNGEIRPVIDFRNINKNIFIDSFALPKIDEILNSVGNSNFYTTLDIKSAFHHVALDEESKPITAFNAGSSKLQFRVLPFGLSSSPSVFQALMSRCLGEILGKIAFCFIDDIIIYSQTVDDHFEHLRNVFTKLREANLHIKLEKCEFFKSKVNYLGHVISREGISYNKSNKIENAIPPKDVKELQRFLGAVNYFRKFIPMFSEIAKPLYKLLQKNQPFDWSEECVRAFDKLKSQLSNPPVLAHPNYDKPFYIFTDASQDGIGACLCQAADQNPKLMRPIMYFSKTLNKAQRRYSTTKREALGLVTAVKQFQYIVTGYPCYVLTDHRPLIFMFNRKNLPADAAMARWCLALQAYDLELKYYPGKKNVVADYLSRSPGLSEIDLLNCETISKNIGNEIDDEEDFETNLAESTELEIRSESCNVFMAKKEQPLAEYIPKLEDVSWSIDELKKEQAEDSFTNTILNYIRDGNEGHISEKELNKYIIISGVLYKQRKIDNRELEILNVVVPTKLMPKALLSIHYTMHNSHVHTLFKFMFRYFHPNEKKLVREFCSECDVCKLLKGRRPQPIKLKSAPIPSRPFDTVSMDFVGPFLKTDNGNKYILSIVDLFSRYCILKALPSRNTEGVIKTLREVFCQYGFPNTLLSDNALEFTSTALNNFAKIYSFKKVEA